MNLKKINIFLILSLILSISFTVYFSNQNNYPTGIHAWAQSDRLALAHGFLNNGFDLFHPETYVYNKQFPSQFMEPSKSTITSVDLPIHEYIVSIIMRIVGSQEPIVFRLYTLFISIVGMFFLYLSANLLLKSEFKALIVILFTISSPIYLFYQACLLPSVCSLAVAFVAIYFYIKYRLLNKSKYFVLYIIFITFSCLTRLPFSMVLTASLCIEILFFFKNKKIDSYKYILFVGSIAVILISYLHNNNLRESYGSIFLSKILPPNSFDEFVEFTSETINKWIFHYFNPLQYLLLIVVIIIGLPATFKNLRYKIDTYFSIGSFTIVLLMGNSLYFILMNFQFINHDYYFLDSFFIPFILLFIVLLNNIHFNLFNNYIKLTKSIILLLFIPVFFLSFKTVWKRQEVGNTNIEYTTAYSYFNSGRFLDSLNISKDAKVLVLSSDGANNSFVYLKRKGFVIIEPSEDKIKKSLSWEFDYVIVSNTRLVNDVYVLYPEIINYLDNVGSNGRITVFKRKKNKIIDIDGFLNLKSYHTNLIEQEDFEQLNKSINISSELNNQNHFAVLDSINHYSYTFKYNNSSFFDKSNTIVKYAAKIRILKPIKNLLVCVSINHADSNTYFKAVNIAEDIPINQWYTKECIFSIPKINYKPNEIGFFLWNVDSNKVQYDDLKLIIY